MPSSLREPTAAALGSLADTAIGGHLSMLYERDGREWSVASALGVRPSPSLTTARPCRWWPADRPTAPLRLPAATPITFGAVGAAASAAPG